MAWNSRRVQLKPDYDVIKRCLCTLLSQRRNKAISSSPNELAFVYADCVWARGERDNISGAFSSFPDASKSQFGPAIGRFPLLGKTFIPGYYSRVGQRAPLQRMCSMRISFMGRGWGKHWWFNFITVYILGLARNRHHLRVFFLSLSERRMTGGKWRARTAWLIVGLYFIYLFILGQKSLLAIVSHWAHAALFVR